MASINNTPRPAYVYDTATNEWIPIGVGAHSHNEIPKTVVDAKGDLIVGTAADEVNRLAVGANGYTLVADSSTSTGLAYGVPSTGNPVLNSAFQIWQRGTSLTGAGGGVYTADRWFMYAGGQGTVSRQTTGDTTNLPFIQYCARIQRNNASADTSLIPFAQSFETVNSLRFAGQTITLSFYARKGANYSPTSSALSVTLATGTGTDQNYSSAGYTGSATPISQTATLTTTWQRFSYSATLSASLTEMAISFGMTPTGTAGAADYYEITGVQIDLGSTALPFRTYANTIQGELAACQRYYQVIGGTASQYPLIGGYAAAVNNQLRWPVSYVVTPRTTPTVTKNGTWSLGNASGPTITMVGAQGFSLEITALAAGMAYAYPDSSDDTVTISAEL